MSETATDHRQARAMSFGGAVEAYERGRPTYPDAAVDWMLAAILPRAAGEAGQGAPPAKREGVAGGGERDRRRRWRGRPPLEHRPSDSGQPGKDRGGGSPLHHPPDGPPPPFHGGGSSRPARVLDLGAGTGKLTRSLVARGLETVAVDPSPAMLARLLATLPAVEAHVGMLPPAGR